jgi:peptidoglycan/xylan/chitin deacetylase (PgdA/CDA1 family)
MRLLCCLLVATTVQVGTAFAGPADIVEPTLHIASGGAASPRVALTFDACMGDVDRRILSVLVDNRIPATIFVTSRWLKRNQAAFGEMLSHPDLFEIENHGARHVPAIDRPMKVYGIAAAGSAAAVDAEVEGGARAVHDAGGGNPRWFRGSTARYSRSAIERIRRQGFRIAGYSLNGDGGSLLGSKATQKRIAAARDGDVVIAHINQPRHAAGEGVAKAIVDLKAKGFTFVRLSDVPSHGSDGTTIAVPSS